MPSPEAPRGIEAIARAAFSLLEGARRSLREGRLAYACATLLLVALLATSLLGRYPINHDVAAHIQTTQRLLAGDRLYTEIVEPNPPLIFYLYVPLLLASRAAGVPAHALVVGYLFLFLLLSAALASRVASVARVPSDPAARRLLLWVFLTASTVAAGYEFGQRDPLMATLAFPYLLAAAGRARREPLPVGLAVAVGLLAAVGLALKPFFLILWLLVEAYLWRVTNDRRTLARPECLAVVSFGALYALWVALGTGYLANLRIVSLSYALYEGDPLLVFAATRPLLWCAALALLVAVREPREDRHLHRLLGIAVVSFVLTALVQRKGWLYHAVPALTYAWIALGAALLALSGRARALRALSRVPPAGIPVGAALAVLWVAWLHAAAARESPDYGTAVPTRVLEPVIRKLAEGRRVAWFTSSCFPAYPATTYAEVLDVMTVGTWPLPSLYAGARATEDGRFPYHAREEMTPIERLVVDRAARDVERGRPELLIFDRRPRRQAFGDSRFDYVDYFSRDLRFRALLDRYAPVVDVGGFRFYKLRPEARARR